MGIVVYGKSGNVNLQTTVESDPEIASGHVDLLGDMFQAATTTAATAIARACGTSAKDTRAVYLKKEMPGDGFKMTTVVQGTVPANAPVDLVNRQLQSVINVIAEVF